MPSFFVLESISEGRAQKVYINTDEVSSLTITEQPGLGVFKATVTHKTTAPTVMLNFTVTKPDPDILQCEGDS